MAKTNRLSRGGPGGGHGSRQHVQTSVRPGAPRERVRHAGVAQIGQAQGNHVTEQGATAYVGVKSFGAGQGTPSELGNARALNVGKGGPGTGRTVYAAGSQQGLQSAKPLPKGRDTLGEFGPDSAMVKRR
jgi:hypothetical protein